MPERKPQAFLFQVLIIVRMSARNSSVARKFIERNFWGMEIVRELELYGYNGPVNLIMQNTEPLYLK